MDTITCIPRKWGNSLGITIPKDVIEREGISEGQPLIISLSAKPDLRVLFGTAKFSKSAQQMKDEDRLEWD
jgi:antitoxin component of MazEF toxin-antitoxin module